MENQVEIIKTEEILGNSVNIYGTFENPLFLAKDIADWIGHSDANAMLRPLDPEEKLLLQIIGSGQGRDMLMVTEDGFYEIMMLSRKPVAKEIKRLIKGILKKLRVEGRVEIKPLTPLEYAEMLVEAEKKVIALKGKIEEDTPKVIFAESISNTTGGILMEDFVKKLCNDTFNIGRTRLFRWLHENNFLYNRNKNNKNIPYQKWLDKGFFFISTTVIETENGSFSRATTRITGAGQIYITNKLKESKEFNIEPKLF